MDSHEPASQPHSPPRAGARQLRILVVDDNRELADACAAILEIEGHEVRIAYSGREALALGAEFAPAVALLDIGMPLMNGFELAKAIRAAAWGHGILLLAMTGAGHAADKRHAREAGFDHHLLKPVDPDFLIAGLQEWTEP